MSTRETIRQSIPLPCVEGDFVAAAKIQPHGIVAVVAGATLTIECISENTLSLLGVPATDLCGAPVAALFHGADAENFTAKLRGSGLPALNPHDLMLAGVDGKQIRVECTVHRREDNRAIIEFEPCPPEPDAPSFDEAHAPIERLAGAADIPTLLANVAHDLRAITGFDQLVIYRFNNDWTSEVVAESAAPGVARNFLGKHFPAEHFPEAFRRLHLRHTLRVIPDTRYVPTRLVAATSRRPPPAVDLTAATLCGNAPEYLDSLVRMGSRASLTLSIVIRGRLWGLISCLNRTPRRLGYRKRAVCELIGRILTWQLDSRLEKEREHSRTVSLQAQIAATLLNADDVGAATLEAAQHILDLFCADGIAVRADTVLRRSGITPRDDAFVLDVAAQLRAQAPDGVAAMQAPADALFMRLTPDGSDFILVFRDQKLRAAAAGAGSALKWTSDDLAAALALRQRLSAQVQSRERRRSEQVMHVNLYLDGQNSQAAALIKLHEDVAAALPSRAAIAKVILAFAQAQTKADGTVMETLTDTEVVSEATTGMLTPFVGMRTARAGSLSGISADLRAPLLCEDSIHDVERSEGDGCRRMGIAAMVVVPIVLSDAVTIVLKAVSGRRGAFGDQDIQTLKLAASNLLTALRAAQRFAALAAAEKEQRTYAGRLRALHAIASTTTSNRKDQIGAALHLGLEQLDLDWAFLGVIDYAAQEYVIENSIGRDGASVVDAGVRSPLGATIVGRVSQAKGVQIIQGIAESGESAVYGGWASYIAAPLFIGGLNYGTIGFASREIRPQPFSDANIEFVAVAAEIIASAVERGLQRERLQTSETRYRALTEAIPEMVWVVDAADQFEYVNARWTNYTGMTLEASRSGGLHAVYDVAHWPSVALARRAVPAVEYDCEVRLRRADGAYRWHLVRSVPFRDSKGSTGKWLVTATDIEERKSAEALMVDVHDAALAATEAKSRFLATMSHEIRTPMNAVIGMTELLLLTLLNEEQREYIEIVRDSGQSLLRVLDDILDYSKIEAGKLELENVDFDLPGQVESVVELLRAQYQIKGVRLTTNFGVDVPPLVVGDPGRLRQILLNLAGNALKFTSPGGRVGIEVAALPQAGGASAIRFTVEDTGIGIAPETVGRLFQPFSQGDESTTRKYGGTGLGLSICAQLVALMNGRIGVRSVPGEGSAFWFEIPLTAANQARKAHDSRKRGAARGKPVVMRPEKILLVEDNEINTLLALKQLQRVGFVVTAVPDGQQAVEAVAREHFDLVFMDCHMPVMDGFGATREIRRLEVGGTRHLTIVAMTADARTADHQNCLRAGMDDYVSKPTSLESLRGVLERWLPAPDRRQNTRSAVNRTRPAATLRVAKLLELFGGDRGAVISLLAAAADSIKADFGRIESAVAAREFAEVAESAHRLKGTSASIRSERLDELCAALQRAASGSSPAVSVALLAELRAAVEGLSADVKKHSQALATLGPIV
jgi:PAS domain S-box-containing protein